MLARATGMPLVCSIAMPSQNSEVRNQRTTSARIVSISFTGVTPSISAMVGSMVMRALPFWMTQPYGKHQHGANGAVLLNGPCRKPLSRPFWMAASTFSM